MESPSNNVQALYPQKPLGPDIFRRKLSHRYMEQAIEALNLYADAARLEFQVAAEAGFLEIAAHVAAKVHRPDLVHEFTAQRDEAVRLARTAKPMRRREKKVR